MLSEEFPSKFHWNVAPNTEVVEFNIVVSDENFCRWMAKKVEKRQKNIEIFCD